MLFKHNLASPDIESQSYQASDHTLAHEDQRRVYIIPLKPLRTYADVIEKKNKSLIKKILQTFPGSRVLSDEESKDIFKFSVSGSYREERPGGAAAISHKRLPDKGKDRKNSKRKRKNRHCHPAQLPFEFLSGDGGTV